MDFKTAKVLDKRIFDNSIFLLLKLRESDPVLNGRVYYHVKRDDVTFYVYDSVLKLVVGDIIEFKVDEHDDIIDLRVIKEAK